MNQHLIHLNLLNWRLNYFELHSRMFYNRHLFPAPTAQYEAWHWSNKSVYY